MMSVVGISFRGKANMPEADALRILRMRGSGGGVHLPVGFSEIAMMRKEDEALPAWERARRFWGSEAAASRTGIEVMPRIAQGLAGGRDKLLELLGKVVVFGLSFNLEDGSIKGEYSFAPHINDTRHYAGILGVQHSGLAERIADAGTLNKNDRGILIDVSPQVADKLSEATDVEGVKMEAPHKFTAEGIVKDRYLRGKVEKAGLGAFYVVHDGEYYIQYLDGRFEKAEGDNYSGKKCGVVLLEYRFKSQREW